MKRAFVKPIGASGHRSGMVAIAGAVAVLLLFVVGAVLHPESVRSIRVSAVGVNVAFVLLGVSVGVRILRRTTANLNGALDVGEAVGIIMGTVHVAHHIAEFFLPLGGKAALGLGAGHMLLIMALFCVAGSAAWERTASIRLAMVAGLWAATLSALFLISFGLSFNLLLESRAVSHLHEAFQASGMNDPGAFVVKNAVESSYEYLLRLPILAVLLSLAGGLASAWMGRRAPSVILMAACLMPIALVSSMLLLWYADTMERSARPPWVMTGLLLAALSLVGLPAVFSVLRRSKRKPLT